MSDSTDVEDSFAQHLVDSTEHRLRSTTMFARLVAERMKLIIELSAGASAYAALFKFGKIWPDLKKVGVILCGGNADMNKIPWMP